MKKPAEAGCVLSEPANNRAGWLRLLHTAMRRVSGSGELAHHMAFVEADPQQQPDLTGALVNFELVHHDLLPGCWPCVC